MNLDSSRIKVLNIAYRNYGGGAANAMSRLVNGFEGSKGLGVDSVLAVVDGEGDLLYKSKGLSKEFDRAKVFLSNYILGLQKTENPIKHSLNWFGNKRIYNIANEGDVDLVHLHWINNETLSIRQISKIKKPVCWTLHDSWLVCGAEHHPYFPKDSRYIDGYSLKDPSLKGVDLNRFNYRYKARVLCDKDLSIIVPSEFMKKLVLESDFFLRGRHSVTVIPHGLNLNVFRPFDKEVARQIFSLDSNKKYILFGAVNSTLDENKGGVELVHGLKEYCKKWGAKDIELIVMGALCGDYEERIGVKVHYMGFVKDELLLPLLYSAADVTVVPSVVESFGLVAAESIACDTPVVCFGATSVSELVENGVTGFVAEARGGGGLSEAIRKSLYHDSFKCREYSLIHLCQENMLKSYRDIYMKILNFPEGSQ